MTIGERLREERERLGWSQPKFAAVASTTKQTLFSWESGKTAPDGFQMAALSEAGVDVMYVLTGQRSAAMPAADSGEQMLLDCYRRCGQQARQNLIQTAALFAAEIGLSDSPATKGSSVRVSSKHGHAAGRDVNVNQGSNNEIAKDPKLKRVRGRP